MGVLQIGTRAISHRELGQLFKNLNYDYFWVTHAKTPRGIHPVIPIIMANVPSNDPNVDAPANVPAPANLENAPAQPIGHGDGFHPWVGGNIPNNQNGLKTARYINPVKSL
ncbi:hypothetical protein Tco_1122013 [Tanacetum coccineum]|uniref:Uncharacterized protein n=1 Tax=Tanacetum coccineum TaxID=301880 RepID=A0ABQ5J2A7_9ASTR